MKGGPKELWLCRRHSWTQKQRNLFFYTTVGNLWIEAVVTVPAGSCALAIILIWVWSHVMPSLFSRFAVDQLKSLEGASIEFHSNLNMEAITASLERSLQNCSLDNNDNNNHHQGRREDGSTSDAGIGISSCSDDISNLDNNHISNSDTNLELNSHISLPYHWEQCLDLKTGEIYYINWKNGMKAKEDPRRAPLGEYSVSRDCESEEESWYDSEESSSESCPSSSKEHYQGPVDKQNVLVVAGCKGCLMYFMVPKQVEDCPKCSSQLLHFDRSENDSP
ncbi:hypothetical protein VNO78_14618 [Psophocarpus tetragonolobus]|uniref:WW domain-containing protein n=1 Tax=Psophocarpus tetragonolobus TaxID=3891 RepID=A0AAN9SEF3_PSOTE